MKTRAWKLLAGIFLICSVSAGGFAQETVVSSKELIDNAKKFDGATVLFEGEVIGDIMKRGTYAWVNIHDGVSAIGCWMPLVLAQGISHAGNYKTKGDWVVVSGEFHRACSMHGGDLDVHAQSLKVTGVGHAVIERVDTAKRNTVIILAGLLCLLLILMRFKLG